MKRFVLMSFLILAFVSWTFADVTEPKTGASFPESMDVAGKNLSLAGTGVRTKFIVKVYAGALYMDAAAKSELASFKAEAAKPSQAVYDAIIRGSFARLFVLHFVRDVDSGKIKEAFEEGLSNSIDINASDVQKDVQSFLAASGADMKEGQEMKILLTGDEVAVTTPSGSSPAIKNQKLAAAVAGIWLGKKPVTEDLKKGLLNRLPQLLQ